MLSRGCWWSNCTRRSLRQPESAAFSLTCSDTSLMSGAPNWVPRVGQTWHNGVTRGEVDSPPPGLICCPEGVGDQIAPGGLSVSKLSPDIPPQGTATGQGWQERTPYTVWLMINSIVLKFSNLWGFKCMLNILIDIFRQGL